MSWTSVARSRIAGVGLAALFCLGVAGVMSAETPDPIPGWLADVDRVRNAFTEAIITARASQVAGDNVTGSADFQIYTKGEDRGLIVFRGGKNDGRKILNVGQKMWLMVPGASRALPITPNQRLLGGASIGDVARVEFAKDYTAVLRPEREEVGGRSCRVLDLTSKSESSPYPRVVLWFDEKEHVPCRLLFSLPSGKKAKDVLFTKFQKAAGRTVVAEMEIRDLVSGDTGTVTRLEYLSIAPAKIDDRFFTPEGALNF
jgi:hypothetical protein